MEIVRDDQHRLRRFITRLLPKKLTRITKILHRTCRLFFLEDKLSWTLWERVDKGLRILKNNKDMRVVVSGGKGPGEWITEAEAMQRYLVKQGIAKERISPLQGAFRSVSTF